jgi:hypothetical protein
VLLLFHPQGDGEQIYQDLEGKRDRHAGGPDRDDALHPADVEKRKSGDPDECQRTDIEGDDQGSDDHIEPPPKA